MEPDPNPKRAANAADELRWLSALAQRLARDVADADDLVQETWLAARRSPSPGPRAWLGGVLRNRERMLRRSEARRKKRELESGEAREAPNAEDELHRQRVLSSVRDALGDLDESDRALLLARYCDGHDAPELGLRLGIPASTVRSRLSRATARVRKNLDERWGSDRNAWAPAVLALPFARRIEVPIAVASGGLLMSTVGKSIVVAVVLLLAAAGLWLGVHHDRTAPEDSSSVRDADAPKPSAHETTRPSEDDGAGGTIRGSVIATSGTPLRGAIVIVAPMTGPSMIAVEPGHASIVPRTFTDAEGRFAIAGLPPGRYAVTAAAPGYLPAQRSAVTLDAPDIDLVFRLNVGGNRIEGTVTDIAGGVVEGELVRARPSEEALDGSDRVGYGALTDADGHYVLSVPDGRWTIVAGGEDYSQATRRVEVRDGPGRADFVLVPGGSIHGRVVSRATGKPVIDALVGFSFQVNLGAGYSSSGCKEEETTRTDAQGRFELRPLEPGTYTVFASASGLASAADPVVHVAVGEAVTDVEVALDPAFDVAGVVVDADDPSRTMPDVHVRAFGDSAGSRWFGMTAADGSFTLHGLPTGTYGIDLEGPGVIANRFDDTLQIEDHDLLDRRFTISRGATVSGRVQPTLAGTVRVQSRDERGGFEIVMTARQLQHAKARIDEDGSFAIDAVPPGVWKLVAEADTGDIGMIEIDVPARGLAGVHVTMTPRARVSGIVRDAAGTAMPGLVVNLRTAPDPTPMAAESIMFEIARSAASAVSKNDGSFDVRGVAPGRYTLAVEDGRGQDVAIIDGPIVVEPDVGRDVTDRVVRVRLPDGRIDGIVRDARGQPVADAWVRARGRARDDPFAERAVATIADADGRFAFENLADGQYGIDVRGPDADAYGSLEGVGLGEHVTIELEAVGEISGLVTQAGRPVTRFELNDRLVIANDGRFVLDRVKPGENHVAVKTDAGAASAQVDVPAGGIAEVTLDIGAWGSIRGVLVSAIDGTPLAGIRLSVGSASGRRDSGGSIVADLLANAGDRTDAEGRFHIDGIGPGKGTVEFAIGTLFDEGHEELGEHAFILAAGDDLDLGNVIALPPLKIAKSERGSLGMHLRGSADDQHVWIEWIEANGPADRAGLQIGDRVLSYDAIEHATVGTRTLLDAMRPNRIRIGQRYAITIDRAGIEHSTILRATHPR